MQTKSLCTVVACSLAAVIGACWTCTLVNGEATDRAPFPTAEQVDLAKYRDAAIANWSAEIAALEARDRTETHPDDSILFVGSSSVRLWDDITTDMAPYHPIQRGYGGARWSDLAIFAERLITPHECRAIVFFVANDIVDGGENDRTPQEVADLFGYVLGQVRKHAAEVPVFYIAVTPTNSRFDSWPEIKAGNSLVSQLCQRTANTYFIGTESVYLDANGKPRPELFLADQLHLSRAGYELWAAAIKSQLDSVLGGAR